MSSSASWKPGALTSCRARLGGRYQRWRPGWLRLKPGGSSTAAAGACRKLPIPKNLPVRSSARSTLPWRPTLQRRTGNPPCAALMPAWRSNECWHAQREDIASTRMDRANMLLRLGRFGEAQAELEACLQVFQNDPAKSATTLSSLAILFNEQGDVPQAVIQERRSLALRELLPD